MSNRRPDMVNEWTRDDLPSAGGLAHTYAATSGGIIDRFSVILDELVWRLNRDHPKLDAAIAEWLDRELSGPDDRPVDVDEVRVGASTSITPQENDGFRALEDAFRAADQALRSVEQERDQARAANDRLRESYREERGVLEGLVGDLRRDLDRVERERDEWKARAEAAEARTEQAEMESGHLRKILKTQMGRVADAEKAASKRADRAGSERDRWRRAHSIVEQERDQAREQWKKWEYKANEWKARAEAAEARTAPAVTREDVEGVIDHWIEQGGNHEALLDDLWRWVSGADPAVFVVRESQIAAVEVERHEGGGTETPILLGHLDDNPSVVRDSAANYLQGLAEAEALARAIEAGQATDPDLVEVAIRNGLNVWGTTDKAVQEIAASVRRVLGQEADQ